MYQTLNSLIFSRSVNIIFSEVRRHAGHSKWANIKHIKAEKDAERALLFNSLVMKMKVAIAEGGSAKPSENTKLSQIIDQAKRANMPVARINAFIEKMNTPREKSKTAHMIIRGPGGCTMMLQFSSDNLIKTEMEIRSRVKKLKAQILDSNIKRLFEHSSYVIAEKDCNLDTAMEDALMVGAIDVEPIEEKDKTYFKFKSDPDTAMKITTQLKKLDYNIVSMEEEYLPKFVVELSDSDLEEAGAVRDKLLKIQDVEEVYDNIV